MTLLDRIVKAKVNMLLRQPFYGQLACHLVPQITEKVPTMAVDLLGNFYVNENFCNKISDEEMAGVIAHEILHLAYLHPQRLGEADPELWNIACDVKINQDLEGVFRLPDGALMPQNNEITIGGINIKNITDKTSEEIYKELHRNAQKVPIKFNADGSASVKVKDKNGTREYKISKDMMEAEGVPKSEVGKLAKEWKEKVSSALQNSKKQGSAPAGLIREMLELETPKLKWDRVIRERFLKAFKTKTWQKINKKWLPHYFAGTKKNKTLNAFIVIDTSGSMGDQELTQIKSEIWGLANTFKGFKLHITTCDAEMYDVYELTEKTKSKFFSIKLKGGGGTSFEPPFKYVKDKMGDNIDCLIYFTDGYGEFPKNKPHYQTYWVINNKDITIPFGKYIYLQ